MSATLDHFATDVRDRCRWALTHNHGHPNRAWSTGEQLAVALVLRDRKHLTAMGYTPHEAAQRVADGMWSPPAEMNQWLDAIRIALPATENREPELRGDPSQWPPAQPAAPHRPT